MSSCPVHEDPHASAHPFVSSELEEPAAQSSILQGSPDCLQDEVVLALRQQNKGGRPVCLKSPESLTGIRAAEIAPAVVNASPKPPPLELKHALPVPVDKHHSGLWQHMNVSSNGLCADASLAFR